MTEGNKINPKTELLQRPPEPAGELPLTRARSSPGPLRLYRLRSRRHISPLRNHVQNPELLCICAWLYLATALSVRNVYRALSSFIYFKYLYSSTAYMYVSLYKDNAKR